MEMKELIKKLNEARNAYYNNNESIMSDYEYDQLFDELAFLEDSTGIVYPNSPTQVVGYDVVSKLKKVEHSHPMLSLDKTKSLDDILKFADERSMVCMEKMDGLTVSLRYENHKLVSAETRGDGYIGEDILHNARVIANIPQKISAKELTVDGEVIISKDTFKAINSQLTEKARIEANDKGLKGIAADKYIKEHSYKNPRNLASGSIRQLDSQEAQKRGLMFIAWKCISKTNNNDFVGNLKLLESNGFTVVPFVYLSDVTDKEKLENTVHYLKSIAEENHYPIDGLVFGYNNIAYGESLGMTGHHLKSQIAFKFYDEESVTTVRNIEWSIGKTGVLTPVAVFDTVDIDGTDVSRASMHNVSYCESLNIKIGDEITVYKANQIIPQIRENLSKHDSMVFKLPEKCPICGSPVKTVITYDESTGEEGTKVLECINPACKGKNLKKLCYFVSKPAMNIDGLSEETIKKFIDLGLLSDYDSIYQLRYKEEELMNLDGFGKRSAKQLIDAIENSRLDVNMANFIVSFGIPLTGRRACKEIAKAYHQDIYEFIEKLDSSNLSALWETDGFGENRINSIQNWYDNGGKLEINGLLSKWIHIKEPVNETVEQLLNGKTFVITGKLNEFSRDVAKEKIEALGGKVSGSVSKNTDYLVNNDVESTSGKNKKAKELGVPIISETDLIKMMS